MNEKDRFQYNWGYKEGFKRGREVIYDLTSTIDDRYIDTIIKLDEQGRSNYKLREKIEAIQDDKSGLVQTLKYLKDEMAEMLEYGEFKELDHVPRNAEKAHKKAVDLLEKISPTGLAI